MEKQYKTPSDWYKFNRSQLRKYQSEWIAFTSEGVIVHDKDFFKVAKATDNLPVSQYIIDYIFDSDFVEPVRLLPVRFKKKRHTSRMAMCCTQSENFKITRNVSGFWC